FSRDWSSDVCSSDLVYDTLADRQPGRIGGFTALVPVFNLGDWMRRGWNDFVLGFDANRQRDLLKPLGLDQLGVRELTLLFAAVRSEERRVGKEWRSP